jgi:hypothetical protein
MLTKDNTPDFDLSVFDMGNTAFEYLEWKFGIESRKRAEIALKKLDDDEMREIEPWQNFWTYYKSPN